MKYSIENLDVYRRAVQTGSRLLRESAGTEIPPTLLAERVQRTAIEMVTSLTDGLGVWEREEKKVHFAAAKRSVLECLPLLEMMADLKLLRAEARADLAGELRDLAKMVSGLLRGARRREGAVAGASEGGEVVYQ